MNTDRKGESEAPTFTQWVKQSEMVSIRDHRCPSVVVQFPFLSQAYLSGGLARRRAEVGDISRKSGMRRVDEDSNEHLGLRTLIDPLSLLGATGARKTASERLAFVRELARICPDKPTNRFSAPNSWWRRGESNPRPW